MGLTAIIAVIVTAFCLDSLLKISIGNFFLQVGVPLLLLIPMWYLAFGMKRRANSQSRLRYDLLIPMLLVYALSQIGMAKSYNVYFATISYLLIAVYVYWTVSLVSDQINWKTMSGYALIVLLITGFGQYVLKNAFGLDIFLRGFDDSYFEGKGALGLRMRGFFLEPNWFGLILFSWFYLYIRDGLRLSIIDLSITTLCMFAFYLSDNRTILFLLILLGLYSTIRRYLGVTQWIMPIITVTLFTGIYTYYSVNCSLVTDRTASARLCTSGNIIVRWESSDLQTKLFGHGFSNWGAYSNELGFSRSNYKRDQPLTRRDNAEPYVFLFEMGALSFLIFAIDLLVVGFRAPRAMDAMFVAAIYITGLFYPIYTFLLYIFPLAVVRAKIFSSRDRDISEAPAEEESRADLIT